MKRLKRLALILTVIAAATIPLAVTSSAPARSCGFNTDEYYVHCDPYTHVLIDARSFWGTTYRDICVGPGTTYLGYLSYWRIVNAWYNGRTC